jgi:methylated-DNA-[protein]-cysteine S-methyltransferase
MEIDSPIGELGVALDGGVVTGVSFGGRPRSAAGPAPPTPLSADEARALAQIRDELDAYFAGHRVDFEVPCAVRRGSDFERAVWAQIAAIPYGETNSYGAIARAVGEPGGAQAVGLACNRNPLPILVPCHRVIGADGRLVGFGGGLSRKRFLLSLEARVHIEHTFAP